MAKPDWQPRLNVDITEEQFNALQKAIPWGLKAALFSHCIDELLKIHEDFGHKGIALLVRHGLVISLKEPTNDTNRS